MGKLVFLSSHSLTMYNFFHCGITQVYQQSIAAVCVQDWPKDRMLVQILDDSDDLGVQGLIKAEVQKWQQRGVHIIYRHRLIHTGYKAGNLKSAMSCDYVKNYEFVAIFDADFQPTPDFLKNTVPYFKVIAFPRHIWVTHVGTRMFSELKSWYNLLVSICWCCNWSLNEKWGTSLTGGNYRFFLEILKRELCKSFNDRQERSLFQSLFAKITRLFLYKNSLEGYLSICS